MEQIISTLKLFNGSVGCYIHSYANLIIIFITCNKPFEIHNRQNEQMVCDRLNKEMLHKTIEQVFPEIVSGGYQITSRVYSETSVVLGIHH